MKLNFWPFNRNKKKKIESTQVWIMSWAVIQYIPYMDNPIVLDSGVYTNIQIEPDIEIPIWESKIMWQYKVTYKSITNYVEWYIDHYHKQNQRFVLLSLTRTK